VTGDYACFTNPLHKVERVSYPFITPSAARAIFDAVYWHPPIRWQVRRIEVLKQPRYTNIMRNEVAVRASERLKGVYAEDYRQQKYSRILKDVAYRIHAQMLYCPPDERFYTKQQLAANGNRVYDQSNESISKYEIIFVLRASRGAYFTHPYLGCREFSVRTLRLLNDPVVAALKKPAVDIDIGSDFMFYDYDYTSYDDGREPKPMFYRPYAVKGVIDVPPFNSQEIWR